MEVQKALKVRLYSTLEQAIFLNKMLRRCRFLYNHAKRIPIHEALTVVEYSRSTVAERSRSTVAALWQALGEPVEPPRSQDKALFESLKEADVFALQRADLKSAGIHPFNSLGVGS
jgi:hypothetical protein